MRSIAGYVRRHHIGLLALFVALGGTAYAVQKAPKDSVVSKSIKDGQVKVRDVKLAKTASYPDLVALVGFDSVEVDLLKVTVPKSGLVSVYAESEIRKAGGPVEELCVVGLRTEADSTIESLIWRSTSTSTFDLRHSAPGTSGAGVSTPEQSGAITVRLPPGPTELEIRYTAGFGSTDCRFQNTKIVAVPLP